MPQPIKNLLVGIKAKKNSKIRLQGKYKQFVKELNSNTFKDLDALRNLQVDKFKSLFIESVDNTEHYKELQVYKKELDSINSYEALLIFLKKLPLLDKESLRNSEVDNIARDADALNFTSGSTGSPTEINYDKEAMRYSFALWKRFHTWIGLPEEYSSVRFSGKIIIAPQQKKPPFWVYNKVNKQLLISTYHLTETNLKAIIDKIDKFKPQLLDGYPSALYVLANYILKNNIQLSFTPIAIATTAETLYSHHKKDIEAAFKSRVFNQYASSEGGSFITECAYENLHLNLDSGIFEFQNSEGEDALPGESAQLINTSFRNLKTPLIRYKTGDMIKLAKEAYIDCPCGSHMPIVDEIIGREDDILFTHEKGFVGRMDPAYKGLSNIKRSQIIQHSPSRIEIVQEVDEGYNKTLENKLISNFRDRLGSEVEIEVKIVDKIPLGKNGKFRSVLRKFNLEEIE